MQDLRGASPQTATPRQGLVLFTCCFAVFIVTLDNTIANVALPSIQRSLHTNLQGLQWIVDAYVLVRGSLLFSAGAASDRFGRRRLFRLGLAVFGAGSLLCSLAPTTGVLVGCRVLQALGGTMLTPSSLAIVATTFQGRVERMRALGIWSATTGISTALGPVAGGLLVQTVGWRSVFWVNIPIAAGGFVLAGRVMNESRAAASRRLDLRGQVLVVLSLGVLTYALIQASSTGWGSTRTIVLLALGGALLLALLATERTAHEPLIDLAALRQPPFAGAVAVAVVAYAAFNGFIFLNTLYLQQVRGYTPIVAGALTVPATIGALVLAPLSGRVTARWGARPPTTAACALMTLGMLALSLTSTATGVVALVACYALLGAGLGLVNPPITNAAVSALPSERAGVAGATTSTGRQVGTVLGIALLGSLASTSGTDHAYVVGAGLVAFGTAVGVLAMGRPIATPGRVGDIEL